MGPLKLYGTLAFISTLYFWEEGGGKREGDKEGVEEEEEKEEEEEHVSYSLQGKNVSYHFLPRLNENENRLWGTRNT